MARATQLQWDKARSLFELGKSLREISDETGIDHSSIGKRAKRDSWEHGILPQIIDDKARILIENKKVESKISTLIPQSVGIVEVAVMEKLVLTDFFASAGKEVAEIALEALRNEPTTRNAKEAMDALKTGLVVTGQAPYHASGVTVNSTAQAGVQINPMESLIAKTVGNVLRPNDQ